MNILISNDDGINAPGIIQLAEIAKQLGKVYVVAPVNQCSGMSQRVSLINDTLIEEQTAFPVEGVQAWSVEGTPVDCIKTGIDILELKPDIVFSGINEGFNLGLDVAYSGTCGVCFEATYSGIPAIAFSGEETNYKVLSKHCLSIAQECMKADLEKNAFWNVNIPKITEGSFHGIMHDCQLAKKSFYCGSFITKRITKTKTMAKINPEIASFDDVSEGMDIHAIKNGCISIGKVYTALI